MERKIVDLRSNRWESALFSSSNKKVSSSFVSRELCEKCVKLISELFKKLLATQIQGSPPCFRLTSAPFAIILMKEKNSIAEHHTRGCREHSIKESIPNPSTISYFISFFTESRGLTKMHFQLKKENKSGKISLFRLILIRCHRGSGNLGKNFDSSYFFFIRYFARYIYLRFLLENGQRKFKQLF